MRLNFLYCLLFALLLSSVSAMADTGKIVHNKASKTISIATTDKKLSLLIDYSKGCLIRQLLINGENKLSAQGVYSAIKHKEEELRSSHLSANVQVFDGRNSVTIKGIKYGDNTLSLNETWHFYLNGNDIEWTINRQYDNDAQVDDTAFPKWNFAGMQTWKGGIFDNGGMIWCKYLKNTGDTYGVHTGGVTFWNADTGDGLAIGAGTDSGHSIAAKYSHGDGDQFTCTQLVTESPLDQRYNLNRFVTKKSDVFAPFNVKKGSVSIHLSLRYINYFAHYSKGTLPGIDAAAVRELLNTTARYGVVDNNIIGGNGWTTNWKCLHEPFFAQMGMAINDENYTRNFSSTLDQERDEAILPDGRVLSRWHNEPGDEIPGTYNARTGYYEAMWGYTVDSQTGYVINLSEQFDLTGDLKWLRTHQQSAEKALGWLIKRDANNNGIFEMVNNNVAERKASDWLDIVYASYENAFVNAQMYEALTLWANCEKLLGSPEKAAHYTGLARRLKTAFNKPVEEGGFWSAAKKQYVYWRDNDGSVHGDNLVTPVNFAAIAYGVCDDPERIATILGQIEQRTTAEGLFHWPLCFDSFKREEVQDGNWPFPKYENGDIFPTWGCLGIRAYAGYNKGLALKYINNILQQYNKDGLSSQRYSRTTQLGLGDDILAGISTSVTALYRDIYGIRPKWNRMGLEPNMSAPLNGTRFNYQLRGTNYQITLSAGNYEMSTKGFTIKCKENFGAARVNNTVTYYHQNADSATLAITTTKVNPVLLTVNSWGENEISFSVKSRGPYTFNLRGLQPGTVYSVTLSGKKSSTKTTANGELSFKGNSVAATSFIIKKN